MTAEIVLTIVVLLVLGAALYWVLRRRTSVTTTPKGSQWKEPFDGVSPVQPLTSRDARQAYQELKSYDKLAPSVVEAAKQEALQELQQIVEDHHKTKKKS
jgi:hypothetical protein